MLARRFLSFLLLLVAVVTFTPYPSAALLIDEGATVFDDEAELRWLKIDATLGLSTLEALAIHSVDGYELATGDEVCDLIAKSGALVADVCPGGTALEIDLGVSAQPFVDLLSDGGGTALLAAYDDGGGVDELAGLAAVGLLGDASVSVALSDRVDVSAGSPGVGTALVFRVTPEPLTGTLLGAGLLGLGIVGRRR